MRFATVAAPLFAPGFAPGLALAMAVGCGGGSQDAPAKSAPPKIGKTKAGPGVADGGKAVPPEPKISAAQLLERAKPLMGALPEVADNPDNPTSEAKVALGKMLYFEARLSKNHDVSCNTCHDLQGYGIDVREEGGKRVATSPGHKGQKGERNSPTVYNAALGLAQFWDGRAADVEEQAKGPILNPVEMAMKDEKAVVATVASIPGYVDAFKAAFPDDAKPITYDNLAKAIGAFERKLMTPGPFDAFMAGDLSALDGEQLRGLQAFMDTGCTQCHTGPGLGGTMFQKLGTTKPWPDVTDEGRFAVTKAAPDKFVFKVPSLRNVTETGPYLHDGSIADLETMVRKMGEHQTDKGALSDSDATAILAFLGALKGTPPKDLAATPELPESGPKTPAPDPS